MVEEKTYFGYSEEELIRVFRESEDKADSNGRLCPESTTLTQLAEASGRLVRDNADLLYEIYSGTKE